MTDRVSCENCGVDWGLHVFNAEVCDMIHRLKNLLYVANEFWYDAPKVLGEAVARPGDTAARLTRQWHEEVVRELGEFWK